MSRARQVALCRNIATLGERQHSLDRKLAQAGVGAGRIAARQLRASVHAQVRAGEVRDNFVVHGLPRGFRRHVEVAIVLRLEAQALRGCVCVQAGQLEVAGGKVSGRIGSYPHLAGCVLPLLL